MSNFTDVGDFHRKFGLHASDLKPGLEVMDESTYQFRFKFLLEELDELEEAWDEGDSAKMFDALIDLVYVAMGTAHLLGFPWQEGWDAVQAANMSKQRAQRAEQSMRGSALDVIKPEGWTPPDIEAVLQRHGWLADNSERS